MRQAGRYMKQYRDIRLKHGILEICKRPDLAAEVTLQPVEILDVDAAIIFADLLLPPFEMALRAGARSVMNSYTDLDGIPVAADAGLLSELLRGRYGFTGTVVSDYFAVSFLQTLHGVAGSRGEAAGLALRVCDEGTVLEETMALARTIASFPPHATRQIKRLMMAARRPYIDAARAGEEAAFASLFADPATNPGAHLTAGLEH